MNEESLDQNERYELLLKEKLAELEALELASRESRETVALDQSRVGRLSRMDAMQGQAMAAETARRRKNEAQRVRAALKRLENDDFGYCLRCEEDISTKRLESDPSAPLCIRCARTV